MMWLDFHYERTSQFYVGCACMHDAWLHDPCMHDAEMHIMHVCRMQIRVIHLCIMRVTNWDEWMNRNLNSSSRISICDNVNIFLHFWHVVMRWAGATTWSRSDQCLVTAPTLSGALISSPLFHCGKIFQFKCTAASLQRYLVCANGVL